MTVNEKIKTMKIEKIKAQLSLDKQTAKISASSPGNVGKYEFLTGEDILPEKNLLEKAGTIKIFEYWTMGSELEKQTSITKDQYQGLDRVYEFNKKILIKQKIKSVLSQIYSIYLFYLFSVRFTFFKNLNNWKLTNLSFKSKQKDLTDF